MGKRENLKLDAFINFELVRRSQNRGDVREFWCPGDSTNSSIKTDSKTIELTGRNTTKERVAII
jgi:hypothetical protein